MSEKILKMFGVSDISRISKHAIVVKCEYLHSSLSNALEELFIANPHHFFFKGIPENLLAPMRLKRVERIAGKRKAGQ